MLETLQMLGIWKTMQMRVKNKIAKKARLEQLEPMEIAQFYTKRYIDAMDMLNVQSPSIQPTASGHIIEQIEIIKKILDAGYAYISEGCLFPDLMKYQKDTNKYGVLSNRVLEDMISTNKSLGWTSRRRKLQTLRFGRRHKPEHIMRWPSIWSEWFSWLAFGMYCQ